MAEDDDETKQLLRKIEIAYREKMELERQVKEEEKEMELLQHHSFTVEYMMDNFRSLMTLMHSATQDMTPFIRLKRNLQRIDFSKMLRSDLLTLEQSYREEWDKLQKEFAEELSWQEKMKNRNIVQEYYQRNLALNKAKQTFEETKISLQKSLQEAQKLTNAARDEMNMLIVSIIEDSKELRNLQEEHHQLVTFKEMVQQLQDRKLELQIELSKLPTPLSTMDLQPSSSSFQAQLQMTAFPSLTNFIPNINPSVDNKIRSLTTVPISEAIGAVSAPTMNSTYSPKKIDKHVHFQKPTTNTNLAVDSNRVNSNLKSSIESKKLIIDKRDTDGLTSVGTTFECNVGCEKPINSETTISELNVGIEKVPVDEKIKKPSNKTDSVSESSAQDQRHQSNIPEEVIVQETEEEKPVEAAENVINLNNPEEISKPKIEILENVVIKVPNLVNVAEKKKSDDKKVTADVKDQKTAKESELCSLISSSCSQLVANFTPFKDFNSYFKTSAFLSDSISMSNEKVPVEKNESEHLPLTEQMVADSELADFGLPLGGFMSNVSDGNNDEGNERDFL
uniref:Uncharacterized protein n=1 Tax=Glossina austeni TaxID=7395 RepID=A0A1A9VEC1_GLOAU